MNQTTNQPNIMIAKVVWVALTGSLFLYAFVLFQLGKLSTFSLPTEALNPFQLVAIAFNSLILGTVYFCKTKIEPKKDFQAKFPLWIVCWALNESVAIMGFVVSFMSEDGNGIFYVVNMSMALLGNILTFPKD